MAKLTHRATAGFNAIISLHEYSAEKGGDEV